jgi:hypothetical protein
MHRITLFSDRVVHVRISGRMNVDDQRALQRLVTTMPDAALRVLVTLEDFRGWERSAAWSADPGFLADEGDRIARMAVVGDEQWREDALLFVGKGFRDTDIAYFPDRERGDAEAWVRA